MLKAGISTKVLHEEMVSEGHRPSLHVPQGGEACVGLVGDVGELGHHEPSAIALHADAHSLILLGQFSIFRLPRTVPPLLIILAFDALPGVVVIDTEPFTNEGRAWQGSH